MDVNVIPASEFQLLPQESRANAGLSLAEMEMLHDLLCVHLDCLAGKLNMWQIVLEKSSETEPMVNAKKKRDFYREDLEMHKTLHRNVLAELALLHAVTS